MHCFYNSPIGTIRLASDGEAITGLHFMEPENGTDINSSDSGPMPIFAQCIKELDEYFGGTRKEFTVKTKNTGTDFMERCWRYLLTIPYGSTCTYAEEAAGINNPKAVRAVGSANGKNNISIIYPCHRVIGKGGKLTGYSGGIWRKEWLLEHEKGHMS